MTRAGSMLAETMGPGVGVCCATALDAPNNTNAQQYERMRIIVAASESAALWRPELRIFVSGSPQAKFEPRASKRRLHLAWSGLQPALELACRPFVCGRRGPRRPFRRGELLPFPVCVFFLLGPQARSQR